MTSRPTKMNDPMTATYSVLCAGCQRLEWHSRVSAGSLHGEAPEERYGHCRRRELGLDGAICWSDAQTPWDDRCGWCLYARDIMRLQEALRGATKMEV